MYWIQKQIWESAASIKADIKEIAKMYDNALLLNKSFILENSYFHKNVLTRNVFVIVILMTITMSKCLFPSMHNI